MSQLIRRMYCATPSVISNKTYEISSFVHDTLGYAPLHPFAAFPYEFFEGGIVGRKESLEICMEFLKLSNIIGVFGVSNGVLDELKEAEKLNLPRMFFMNFHRQWKDVYEDIKVNHDNILNKYMPLVTGQIYGPNI